MKNTDCCDIGEHSCDVMISTKRGNICADRCISDIICALNNSGINTVASCCGHGKLLPSIVLRDGRELLIRKFKPMK